MGANVFSLWGDLKRKERLQKIHLSKGKSSQMFPTKTEQERRKTTTRPILWHWSKRQRQGKRLLVYVEKKHLLDARHYWKRLWRANERDGGRKSGCCRKKTQIRLEKRGNVGCEIQLCSSSRAHVNSIRPTVRLFTAAASLDVALTASQFQSNNSCSPAQHPSAEAGTW